MSATSSARVLLAWSSGKDSAWALHRMRSEGVNVVGLLTTMNESLDRVAMHAVRRELLEAQAVQARLPLVTVPLPWPCSNTEYEQRMGAAMEKAKADRITHIAFGDLYLEDIRDYRIRQLHGSGIEPMFPLWCSAAETPQLARSMVADGVRAVLTCVDPRQLAPEFVGRIFDAQLLDQLPPDTDPCGERGEFHSFATHGPMFERPIDVTVGAIVEQEGYRFADLLPVREASRAAS